MMSSDSKYSRINQEVKVVDFLRAGIFRLIFVGTTRYDDSRFEPDLRSIIDRDKNDMSEVEGETSKGRRRDDVAGAFRYRKSRSFMNLV